MALNPTSRRDYHALVRAFERLKKNKTPHDQLADVEVRIIDELHLNYPHLLGVIPAQRIVSPKFDGGRVIMKDVYSMDSTVFRVREAARLEAEHMYRMDPELTCIAKSSRRSTSMPTNIPIFCLGRFGGNLWYECTEEKWRDTKHYLCAHNNAETPEYLPRRPLIPRAMFVGAEKPRIAVTLVKYPFPQFVPASNAVACRRTSNKRPAMRKRHWFKPGVPYYRIHTTKGCCNGAGWFYCTDEDRRYWGKGGHMTFLESLKFKWRILCLI